MQSETLAQEFARLVKEYHEGDDRTKPEAWNLLADYAVDNADAISAALSDKQAGEVKIKPLEWNRDDDTASVDIGATYCLEKRAGYCALVTMAAKVLQRDVFPTLASAKAAAQADYEQRIRSALVDVPAIEPVAIYHGNGLIDCGDAGHHNIELVKLIPAGTKLYASPLREGEDSAEAFARIVAARKAYVDATETYNTRLALVNSERAKGNWSMRVDDEASAMWDAQSAFIKAAQDETDAALAATRGGSSTTAKGISE